MVPSKCLFNKVPAQLDVESLCFLVVFDVVKLKILGFHLLDGHDSLPILGIHREGKIHIGYIETMQRIIFCGPSYSVFILQQLSDS
jgi:hypothetical protein